MRYHPDARAMPDASTHDDRGSLLFSAWVSVLLAVTLPLVWVTIALAPAGDRTHRLIRRFSRALIGMSLCRLRVHGVEQLTDMPCAVLVANHSSYLDSVVLIAAIPHNCRFVVNHIASTRPLLGLIIRKAGYLVVDRGSWRSRAACGRAMTASLEVGTSLLLFPEGTRAGRTAVLPFKTGAFRAAARTGRSVVPVAITGTRRVLPRQIRLLRRGPIDVHILQAIHPDARTIEGASRLRDAAAAAIAEVLHAAPEGHR